MLGCGGPVGNLLQLRCHLSLSHRHYGGVSLGEAVVMPSALEEKQGGGHHLPEMMAWLSLLSYASLLSWERRSMVPVQVPRSSHGFTRASL